MGGIVCASPVPFFKGTSLEGTFIDNILYLCIIAAVLLVLIIVIIVACSKKKKKPGEKDDKTSVVQTSVDTTPIEDTVAETPVIEAEAEPVQEVAVAEDIIEVDATEDIETEALEEQTFVEEQVSTEQTPVEEHVSSDEDEVFAIPEDITEEKAVSADEDIYFKPVKVVVPQKAEEPETKGEVPAEVDYFKPVDIKPVKKAEEPDETVLVPKSSKPATKKPTTKKVAAKETPKIQKPKVRGKYVIDTGSDIFQFKLYANNGQLLYESREYASKTTCASGIETFVKNISDCDYRIAQDKNGAWKFIFKKGNSIYIGESYPQRTSAESAAESVKRFASNSDIVLI